MLIKDFIPLNVDEFKDVVRNRTISCFEKTTRLSLRGITYSLVFEARNEDAFMQLLKKWNYSIIRVFSTKEKINFYVEEGVRVCQKN